MTSLIGLSAEALVHQVKDIAGEELLGILLTGSVALGTANSYSDLDLYAIISRGAIKRKFYRWSEAQVDVDLWLVTPQYIRVCFKSSASITHCFAVGKAVFDTHNALGTLVSEAQVRYSAGPIAQTSSQIAQLRHRVTTILDDCARLVNTKTTEEANFFMYAALHSLLGIHCALNRIWCHDDRTLIADIRKRSPSVSAIAERVINAAIAEHRASLIVDLAAEILKNFGGPLKYFDCTLYEPKGLV
jgi:hypothetical protein